jgi:hypothetical protein
MNTPENGLANVYRKPVAQDKGKWATVVRRVMNFRLTQRSKLLEEVAEYQHLSDSAGLHYLYRTTVPR